MIRPAFRPTVKAADPSNAATDSGSTTARVPRVGRRRLRRLAALTLSAGVLGAGLLATAPASAATGGTLARIKACESGGSYRAYNASSGASGAYQFLNSTWRGLPAARGYATAASAPPAVQDRAARQLFASAGSTPWTASASCWRSGSAAAGPAVRSYRTSPVHRSSTNDNRSEYRSTETGYARTGARRTTGFVSHRYTSARAEHEGSNGGWGEHRSSGGESSEHED